MAHRFPLPLLRGVLLGSLMAVCTEAREEHSVNPRRPALCVAGGVCPAGPAAECPTGSARLRVLATGATGMIGSFVVRELVAEPCTEVFALVRWRSNVRNLQGVLERLRVVYGDITDAFRMRDIVRQVMPDEVYHFAGQAINNAGFDSPQHTLEANVMGTLNLLEALRDAGLANRTRLLYAGSSTEYGKTGEEWEGAIPETAPLVPVSPYGVSKVAAEMLARQYWLAHGVQSITARIFIHVAPGGTEHLALQEFCRQIAMIERGLQAPVLLHGNLDALRDMTDVRDSAPVFLALLRKGLPGEAYNLGSDTTYSTRQIVDLAVAQAQTRVELRVDPTRFRLFDEKALQADITKLRELTGWRPHPDMARTVRQVLEHWRAEVALRYPDTTGMAVGETVGASGSDDVG